MSTMDGGYPNGGAPPPPQMMGYYSNMAGYPSVPQTGVQTAPPNNSRNTSSVSIWAGDLDSYMDENFLRQAVTACGWGTDITRIKVVRDRYTGVHAGYGFLDAASPEAAARVLAMGSGMPIPGSNRCWRLNMGRSASGSSGPAAGSETNVYVGDLEPNVTEFQLMSTFRPRYASVRHAKVVCNDYGHSRGFGFVRFADSQEAERAVSEMQGFEFNGKPIRLSPATGRSRSRNNSGGSSSHNNYQNSGHGHHNFGDGHPTNKRPRQVMSPDDPNNTTLFIGGTANHITEELLWREFSCFGELEAVRVPTNKTGFAFVRFKTRECAQRAKEELSRTHVVSLNPHKPVRLEWATEQLAVTRPPPSAISGLQGLGGGQPYDQQFPPAYSAPSTAPYNYPPASAPDSNHPSQNQSSGVVGGLMMSQAASPLTGRTSGSMSAGMMSGTMAGVSTSTPGMPGHTGPNGTAMPSAPGKTSDKSSGHDAAKAQGPQQPATSAAVGETEPPSKRAAVGRSEYAATGKESNDSQANVEEFKKGSDGVPSAPFSWLSAPPSQPPSNPQ